VTSVQGEGASSAQAGGAPAPTPPPFRHGTVGGSARHKREGTRVCLPCADALALSRRAGRIATGQTRELRIPVPVLAELLDSWTARAVLVDKLGVRIVGAIEAAARRQAAQRQKGQ
jgi:hypothetical protein